jgi:hypothetical protein
MSKYTVSTTTAAFAVATRPAPPTSKARKSAAIPFLITARRNARPNSRPNSVNIGANGGEERSYHIRRPADKRNTKIPLLNSALHTLSQVE